MINYLYWGLFIGGLILVYFAFKNYNSTNSLVENGIKTTATVTELITIHDSDGNTYKPVFEYTDKTNTKKEFKSDVSSRPAAYSIGEKAKIVYNPKNDNEIKIVSFWGLYRWTIILLSIASPLIIIGDGYLLYTKG